MNFREIAQHNRASLVIIIFLLICDILGFSILYRIHFNYSSPESQLFFIISFLFIGYLSRGYNPSPLTSRKREIKDYTKIYIISIGSYLIFQISFQNIASDQMRELTIFWFRLLILTLMIRLLVRWIQKLFLASRIGLRNVIIIGNGEPSLNIIHQLKNSPILGYNVMGYIASKNDPNIDRITDYIGTTKDIDNLPFINDVDDIIISSGEYSHDEILNLIGEVYSLSICIKIIPDMYEALTGKVKMSMLYGLPLIDINPQILTEYQQLIKRLIDVLMSTILFVTLLPISILSMLAIKLSSSGSIFYIQTRVGKNNRSFKLFKFRTMFENSEIDSGPVWASIDDPRITGIGRLLRKFRIDEIPQLLNVFKGDMSIVGPRPERPFFVEKLTARFPYYSRRLCLRPGITGWAQVVGDYDTTLENVESKLKHDFYYIENISMLLDIKIMFMTLIILLKGRGR